VSLHKEQGSTALGPVRAAHRAGRWAGRWAKLAPSLDLRSCSIAWGGKGGKKKEGMGGPSQGSCEAAEMAQPLEQDRVGNDHFRSRLIANAGERLRRLTRKMLRDYPGLRRWEQTDDVLQNALLRLYLALEQTRPESVRHFYGLAARHIRRELIDLAQYHLGRQGHHTEGGGETVDDLRSPLDGKPGEAASPESLEAWTRFHQAVEGLPDEEREIFDLLWYQTLTQEQATAVLGVSLRTVKRRWQAARVRLVQALGDDPPV
jgi:RNA polymerase sigma-70 factor (ECF subfamily)